MDEERACLNREYKFISLVNVDARISMDRRRKRARNGHRYDHYCQLHHELQRPEDITDMFKCLRTSQVDVTIAIKASGEEFFTTEGPVVDNALMLCWTCYPLLGRFYRSLDGRPEIRWKDVQIHGGRPPRKPTPGTIMSRLRLDIDIHSPNVVWWENRHAKRALYRMGHL